MATLSERIAQHRGGDPCPRCECASCTACNDPVYNRSGPCPNGCPIHGPRPRRARAGGDVMTLSERIAREDAQRPKDAPPSSGVIMCVRCKAPARDCEHAPAWVQRMARNTYVRPGGR